MPGLNPFSNKEIQQAENALTIEDINSITPQQGKEINTLVKSAMSKIANLGKKALEDKEKRIIKLRDKIQYFKSNCPERCKESIGDFPEVELINYLLEGKATKESKIKISDKLTKKAESDFERDINAQEGIIVIDKREGDKTENLENRKGVKDKLIDLCSENLFTDKKFLALKYALSVNAISIGGPSIELLGTINRETPEVEIYDDKIVVKGKTKGSASPVAYDQTLRAFSSEYEVSIPLDIPDDALNELTVIETFMKRS